jgi:two-component system response regulator AlgR
VRRLQTLLAKDPRLEIIGTACDALAALQAIEHAPPALVLLDIEMPGMDGIALARALSSERPDTRIIFVTAHDSFALSAFDLAAAGYILKPIDPAKLAKGIDDLLREPIGRPRRDEGSLWVSSQGKLHRLAPEQIVRLQAERDYVRIFTGVRTYLMTTTMHALLDELSPSDFVRIHRSHAVKLSLIETLSHKANGVWEAVLEDGFAVPIGRTYLRSLRDRLGIET